MSVVDKINKHLAGGEQLNEAKTAKVTAKTVKEAMGKIISISFDQESTHDEIRSLAHTICEQCGIDPDEDVGQDMALQVVTDAISPDITKISDQVINKMVDIINKIPRISNESQLNEAEDYGFGEGSLGLGVIEGLRKLKVPEKSIKNIIESHNPTLLRRYETKISETMAFLKEINSSII
jgi:hypothetical protein